VVAAPAAAAAAAAASKAADSETESDSPEEETAVQPTRVAPVQAAKAGNGSRLVKKGSATLPGPVSDTAVAKRASLKGAQGATSNALRRSATEDSASSGAGVRRRSNVLLVIGALKYICLSGRAADTREQLKLTLARIRVLSGDTSNGGGHHFVIMLRNHQYLHVSPLPTSRPLRALITRCDLRYSTAVCCAWTCERSLRFTSSARHRRSSRWTWSRSSSNTTRRRRPGD
jgi:hypothetical protein